MANRYDQLIEKVFFDHYTKGRKSISFTRDEFESAASQLGIKLPKNVGDVVYSYRYRNSYPESILKTAPAGYQWVIRPDGKSKYKMDLIEEISFEPSPHLVETKILDSTPGIISKYALSDEQALLAVVRYSRLVDIFTGLTCYSLQNHLRTTVKGMGQVETDEVYVGVDKRGAHYVIPIQAKGGKDKLGVVQIEQDFAIAAAKFPELICKPMAAQFMKNDVIALFEFELNEGKIKIASEKHYKLVGPDSLSSDELERYKNRPE